MKRAWLLVLLLVIPAPVFAQDAESEEEAAAGAPEDSDDSFEFRMGYYHNDDSGDGNPFLDEEETVIEPIAILKLQVTESVTVTAQGSYDFVSSASIDRLSKFPNQSGASRDNYLGGDLGVQVQATDDLKLGAHVGYSTEYDYDSFGFGANLSVDFNEKNTTLSLGGNIYLDSVRVIRFNGLENEGDEDRTSYTLNVGLYQILTPTVHMSAGYTFTHQNGFLETAYNAVVLEDPSDLPNVNLDNNARGVEVTEELPDGRNRHAVYGQLRKYFETGTAVELGGRVYTDDWGIDSGAIELRLYQWIVDDVLRVRARYRFYSQTASDYHEDRFFVPPAQRAFFQVSEDRTQDSDLAAFSSSTIGLRLDVVVPGGVNVDLSVDYVLRDDGIDQLLLGFGIRAEF